MLNNTTHPHRPGDICLYSFGKENKSRAVVEIIRLLKAKSPEAGDACAEIKFRKVMVDDTGNGLFAYLLKSGKTMNASLKYLTILPEPQNLTVGIDAPAVTGKTTLAK